MHALPDMMSVELQGTFPWARITRVGLQVLRPLSSNEDEAWREWTRTGAEVESVYAAGPWALADWIEAGQARFGEKYSQAMNWTRYSYKHLANITWVARKFEFSRRREELSFGHHAAVACLPPKEADAILSIAIEHSWSIDTMIENLRGEGIEVDGHEVQIPQRLAYAIKVIDGLLAIPGLLGSARQLVRGAREALERAGKELRTV